MKHTVTPYFTAGENLIDAAIREVQEETDIKTTFHSLVTVGHAHNMQFDCSNMYIILNLKPLTNEISKCDREIADCQWMKVDEFLVHPHVHEFNKTILNAYFECKNRNIKIGHTTGVHEILHIPYGIYHIMTD